MFKNRKLYERRRAHFGHFWAPRDVRYHLVDFVEEAYSYQKIIFFLIFHEARKTFSKLRKIREIFFEFSENSSERFFIDAIILYIILKIQLDWFKIVGENRIQKI